MKKRNFKLNIKLLIAQSKIWNMHFKIKCFTFFVVSIFGSIVFADTLDLLCEPRDVFDAGYRVASKIDDNGVLKTEIFAVSGWGGDKKLFSGPSFIMPEQIDQKCTFKIVDRTNSPDTVIVLRIGEADILQKLNGENLTTFADGKEVNIFNKISCSGSKKLTDQLKSLCQWP